MATASTTCVRALQRAPWLSRNPRHSPNHLPVPRSSESGHAQTLAAAIVDAALASGHPSHHYHPRPTCCGAGVRTRLAMHPSVACVKIPVRSVLAVELLRAPATSSEPPLVSGRDLGRPTRARPRCILLCRASRLLPLLLLLCSAATLLCRRCAVFCYCRCIWLLVAVVQAAALLPYLLLSGSRWPRCYCSTLLLRCYVTTPLCCCFRPSRPRPWPSVCVLCV